MISVILMDVEGTTTSIDFVHKELFPYARAYIGDFVEQRRSQPEVLQCIENTAATLRDEGLNADATVVREALERWIDEDRKHPALKQLQGLLWEEGYRSGVYQGHLYADVLPCWLTWRGLGKQLAIYSSGSVQAQKLLFSHTAYGDLTGHLSAHFDTRVGPKREAASYMEISKSLKIEPGKIMFLSDVAAELDAAAQSGMKTCQLVRPGTKAGIGHPIAEDFNQVVLA